MASLSTNGASKEDKTETKSLRDELRDALPASFHCKTRYLHSPPRPCDPLFSALPGQEQEKTRLASHFLTVSVDAASLPQPGTGDVINLAIEVLVYTTKKLTTIFVSKVDSTSYIRRLKPSPIKTTVTTFLKWLAEKERRKRPSRKIVISLFARAQAQYLFPGSSDDKGKHVLDDRQLIKWWAKVLDPIIPHQTPGEEELEQETVAKYQGYLTVPGYAKTELRSFMPPPPPSPSSPTSSLPPRWLPGNPLLELGRTRGIPEHAPPRCLLPRFPDDPKARFISDLDDEIGVSQETQNITTSPSKTKSGRWKSVMSLDQFWEQMEFRQECSSGRVVGFLWVVVSPLTSTGDEAIVDAAVAAADSQSSTTSASAAAPPSTTTTTTTIPKKSPRKQRTTNKPLPLSGPIIPRLPRIKSSQSALALLSTQQSQLDPSNGIPITAESYDKAISTMLHLDFSTLEAAIWSTAKWVDEVRGVVGLIDDDFAGEVVGRKSVKVEAVVAEAGGLSGSRDGGGGVNDMSGMVRKKRKVGEVATGAEAVQPTVNVLGGGMVRKKPKPAAGS